MVDWWRLNDQKMSKTNARKTVKQFKSVNPLTAISLPLKLIPPHPCTMSFCLVENSYMLHMEENEGRHL